MILSGVFLLKKGIFSISRITALTICIVILWGVYIYINDTYINPGGIGLKSTLIAISIILFIALTFYLNKLPGKKNNIFLFFTIVAGVESIWCMLQAVDLIRSSHAAFKVTGSWANPNITAMFLALIIPYVVFNVINKYTKNRSIYVAILTTTAIALVLLKCRTAMLGSILAFVCILEYRFRLIKTFLQRSSNRRIILMAFLLTMFVGCIGYAVYQFKKDSADGRRVIWNLSINIMFRNPLFGSGYGSFERVYNIEQAHYFQNKTNSEREKYNASHTSTAYNEFLENTIEGGILGGLFFGVFIGVLFFAGVKYLKMRSRSANPNVSNLKQDPSDETLIVSSLTGILLVFFMSLINFTVTAVPVMCMFIFYASTITSLSGKKCTSVIVAPTLKRIFAVSLIISALVISYKSTVAAYQQTKIKSADDAAKHKDFEGALKILKTLPTQGQVHENYHQILANVLYAMNNKSAALAVYQDATYYYSSPDLYQQLGNCFFANKDYKQAIRNYEIAKYIQPNRFAPRHLLLRTYVELKDKRNAINIAREIIEMDEKIPSRETALYRKSASDLLKKLTKNK